MVQWLGTEGLWPFYGPAERSSPLDLAAFPGREAGLKVGLSAAEFVAVRAFE